MLNDCSSLVILACVFIVALACGLDDCMASRKERRLSRATHRWYVNPCPKGFRQLLVPDEIFEGVRLQRDSLSLHLQCVKDASLEHHFLADAVRSSGHLRSDEVKAGLALNKRAGAARHDWTACARGSSYDDSTKKYTLRLEELVKSDSFSGGGETSDEMELQRTSVFLFAGAAHSGLHNDFGYCAFEQSEERRIHSQMHDGEFVADNDSHRDQATLGSPALCGLSMGVENGLHVDSRGLSMESEEEDDEFTDMHGNDHYRMHDGDRWADFWSSDDSVCSSFASASRGRTFAADMDAAGLHEQETLGAAAPGSNSLHVRVHDVTDGKLGVPKLGDIQYKFNEEPVEKTEKDSLIPDPVSFGRGVDMKVKIDEAEQHDQETLGAAVLRSNSLHVSVHDENMLGEKLGVNKLEEIPFKFNEEPEDKTEKDLHNHDPVYFGRGVEEKVKIIKHKDLEALLCAPWRRRHIMHDNTEILHGKDTLDLPKFDLAMSDSSEDHYLTPPGQFSFVTRPGFGIRNLAPAEDSAMHDEDLHEQNDEIASQDAVELHADDNLHEKHENCDFGPAKSQTAGVGIFYPQDVILHGLDGNQDGMHGNQQGFVFMMASLEDTTMTECVPLDTLSTIVRFGLGSIYRFCHYKVLIRQTCEGVIRNIHAQHDEKYGELRRQAQLWKDRAQTEKEKVHKLEISLDNLLDNVVTNVQETYETLGIPCTFDGLMDSECDDVFDVLLQRVNQLQVDKVNLQTCNDKLIEKLRSTKYFEKLLRSLQQPGFENAWLVDEVEHSSQHSKLPRKFCENSGNSGKTEGFVAAGSGLEPSVHVDATPAPKSRTRRAGKRRIKPPSADRTAGPMGPPCADARSVSRSFCMGATASGPSANFGENERMETSRTTPGCAENPSCAPLQRNSGHLQFLAPCTIAGNSAAKNNMNDR